MSISDCVIRRDNGLDKNRQLKIQVLIVCDYPCGPMVDARSLLELYRQSQLGLERQCRLYPAQNSFKMRKYVASISNGLVTLLHISSVGGMQNRASTTILTNSTSHDTFRQKGKLLVHKCTSTPSSLNEYAKTHLRIKATPEF